MFELWPVVHVSDYQYRLAHLRLMSSVYYLSLISTLFSALFGAEGTTVDQLVSHAREYKLEFSFVELTQSKDRRYFLIGPVAANQSAEYELWKKETCYTLVLKDDIVVKDEKATRFMEQIKFNTAKLFFGCPKKQKCCSSDCCSEAKISQFQFDPAPILIILLCFISVGIIVGGVEFARRKRQRSGKGTKQERLRAYITTAAEVAIVDQLAQNGSATKGRRSGDLHFTAISLIDPNTTQSTGSVRFDDDVKVENDHSPNRSPNSPSIASERFVTARPTFEIG